MTRQAAWQAIVGGSFGYTYGGQGIWWACYNESYVNFNCGDNGSPNFYVWYQTLNFSVGSVQMPLMKSVLTNITWWHLAPDANIIKWASTAPQDTQQPYQKVNEDSNLVLAYLPASHCGTYNGSVQGLNTSSSYKVDWINPRNGSVVEVYNSVEGPTIPLPTAPDSDDWVLLVRPSGGDIGGEDSEGKSKSGYRMNFREPQLESARKRLDLLNSKQLISFVTGMCR